MTYPKYDFDSTTLDYTQVNDTNNDMFSDLVYQCGCCGNAKEKDIKAQVTPLMTSIVIDEANGNTTRYKDGVKSVYIILYTFLSA